MKARIIVFMASISIFALLASSGWAAKLPRAAKKVKAKKQKIAPKAEITIFPVNPHKRPAAQPVERVLTGNFFGRTQDSDNIRTPDGRLTDNGSSDLRKQPTRRQTPDTIAWMAAGGFIYHDPFLDCGNVASGSEKIWVNNIIDLCGLGPCDECFKKTAHAPEFIIKECKGLDLASASGLLDNKGFLAWVTEHLPVRNPVFLSTRKLLVYPKLEMTDNGLLQLLKETETAYRRHTWKVIEVIGKKSELDTDNVSSFSTIDSTIDSKIDSKIDQEN